MKKHSIGYLILPLLLIPSLGYARLGSSLGVNEMYDSADVVLKGEVVGIGKSSPIKFSSKELVASPSKRFLKTVGSEAVSAKIRVDKIFKGTVSGNTIEVNFYSAKSQDFQKLSQGEAVLLFLKRDADKLYLLSYDYGKIPDKITMVSRKQGIGKSGQEGFVGELEEMSVAKDTSTVLAGMDGLISLKAPNSASIFRQHLSDSRLSVRAKAILGLVQLGDSEGNKEFLKELQSDTMNSSNLTGQERQEARWEFIQAMMYMGNSKKTEYSKILIPLVNSKDKFIRQASINALRQIKSEDAVPTFVALLDDPDFKVQYMAVISLCEINNPKKTGCPSSVLFGQNPQKYITEWKKWWSTHKK